MDMSPRCLAARGMFSGQGGLVYTEMAPKCSCRAGDPCRRWASLPKQPLSDTLPSLGKVGASAALQREEPVDASGRTHGLRHRAAVRFGQQRWHERQLYEVQLTSGLDGMAWLRRRLLPCRAY